MAVCDVCEAVVGDDEVIELDGHSVCAVCKPAAVQRLSELGAAVSDPLGDIEFRDFKKLYNATATIRAMTGLWLLMTAGMVIWLILGLLTTRLGPIELLAIAFGGVIYGFGFVGAIKRTNWGRIVGLLHGWAGVVLIVLSWVAALTGVGPGNGGGILLLLGCVSVIRSFGRRELFGPERFEHKDIVRVWKERRKMKV